MSNSHIKRNQQTPLKNTLPKNDQAKNQKFVATKIHINEYLML